MPLFSRRPNFADSRNNVKSLMTFISILDTDPFFLPTIQVIGLLSIWIATNEDIIYNRKATAIFILDDLQEITFFSLSHIFWFGLGWFHCLIAYQTTRDI